MAPEPTALTTKLEGGSPYQLDPAQVSRAATALVNHIQSARQQKEVQSEKRSLLAAAGDGSDLEQEDDVPLWLVLTTKKHVVDKKRLKPGKIALPHSLHSSPTSRICLITADPQRTYKDIIAHPSFSPALASRIGRVIGLTKLKAKYKSYESRRQLLSEYDAFLADDRIITYLPAVLGKTFYKGGSKRPVPVSLAGRRLTEEQKEKKKDPQKRGIDPLKPRKKGPREGEKAGTPAELAREIEKALSAALIHLSPSASTAVKVARGSWEPQKIVENVEVVVRAMTERFIPKGWRNVRAFHLKGPETAALPLWLAEELWVDEGDVLEEGAEAERVKRLEDGKRKKSKKRKSEGEGEDAGQKRAKKMRIEGKVDSSQNIPQRKESLKQQKAAILSSA